MQKGLHFHFSIHRKTAHHLNNSTLFQHPLRMNRFNILMRGVHATSSLQSVCNMLINPILALHAWCALAGSLKSICAHMLTYAHKHIQILRERSILLLQCCSAEQHYQKLRGERGISGKDPIQQKINSRRQKLKNHLAYFPTDPKKSISLIILLLINA